MTVILGCPIVESVAVGLSFLSIGVCLLNNLVRTDQVKASPDEGDWIYMSNAYRK